MARRLLIVHGGHELYGSDRACLRIAEGARAAGWHVEVLIPAAGLLADELSRLGLTTHILDPLVIRRADLRGARAAAFPFLGAIRAARLLAFARRDRFDIVHTNTAPAVGGALLARRWRCPHVWHVHEIFWQPRPVVRAFERMLSSAEIVVCASGAVRDQFEREDVRAKCVVAPTGADVPSGIAEHEPLANAPDDVHLTCVARLNEWKGQETLIDAMALVRDHVPGARLSLVGDVFRDEHHYRERLRAHVAALGLGNAVSFLGERRDALEIVAASDIFVLPSRRAEPFGMALVEAMALGRPSIATAAGGPLEIVNDDVDGVLVPPGDPVAMAAAIRRLVEDVPFARRLATAARERARVFTTAAMVEKVLAAYDAAAGR